MEPLSLATGILTVLAATGSTAKGLEKLSSLRTAGKDLLSVMNELAALSSMLRTVELSLRSLQTSETDMFAPILVEIDSIKNRASLLIEELNAEVKKTLREDGEAACGSEIKVRKRKWLRQSKHILKFRSDLSAMVIALSAALTALNALQLASLRSSETQRITFAVQDISLVANNGSDAASMVVEEVEEQMDLEARLTETMATITDRLSSPAAPVIEGAASLLSPMSTSGIVRVTASVGQELCTRFCRCQCHIQVKTTSPKWVTTVLGSLHFQTNGTVLLNRRSCNYPLTCKRSGAVTAQMAYYAPAWAFARAFAIGIMKDDIRGIAAYFGSGATYPVALESRIFRLVEKGDIEGVRKALVGGQGSLFDVDSMGETILHYAARIYNAKMCAELIKMGANRMRCSSNGVPMYELGLDHVFANPPWSKNIPDDDIHLFAQLFADEETFIDLDMTILHRIVLALVSTSLGRQLQLGNDDINAKDAGGRTPLMWASRRGDVASIRTLLAYGADPNITDRSDVTPLHKAVADADDESVLLLLEAGAMSLPDNHNGAYPLHNLAFCPRYRPVTIRALIAYGADIEARDYSGRTPLSWLNGNKRRAAEDNAAMLVACGADIDCPDDWGDTPVNDAVICDDLGMLRALIILGARLDVVAKCGCSIIKHAALKASVPIWRLLTEAAEAGQIPATVLQRSGSCKHMGHDIWTCLSTCRDESYLDERPSHSIELMEFRKLVAAIQASECKLPA